MFMVVLAQAVGRWTPDLARSSIRNRPCDRTESIGCQGGKMSAVRRVLEVVAGAVSVVAVGATPALAAPVNSPKTEEFPVTCPSGPVVVVAPPGNGDFTPGFLVGTHQVFIPYRFVFLATDASGNVLEQGTDEKRAPIPSGAITCTFGGTFTEGDITITFTGSATGVIRGKP